MKCSIHNQRMDSLCSLILEGSKRVLLGFFLNNSSILKLNELFKTEGKTHIGKYKQQYNFEILKEIAQKGERDSILW